MDGGEVARQTSIQLQTVGRFSDVIAKTGQNGIRVYETTFHYAGKSILCVWFNDESAVTINSSKQYFVSGAIRNDLSVPVLWSPRFETWQPVAATSTPARPVVKKKKSSGGLLALVFIFLAIVGIGSVSRTTNNPSSVSNRQTNQSVLGAQTPQAVQSPTIPTVPTTPTKQLVSTPVATSPPTQNTSSTQLSNYNTYINSAGYTVHSPATTTDNTIPAGASAKCRDGTYSFSQSRSGTCSHHGGVATWL